MKNGDLPITPLSRDQKESRIPELLAPAGNLEKLQIAIHYGADAVYLAGERFSLRAHATLSEAELQTAVAYAHDRSVKVYVTVNIFAHNRDLTGLARYLQYLQKINVDALIISDPGIFMTARKITPEIPIHLSTQANVTNRESALFWQNQGAVRINLARELSLLEITDIRKAIKAEIEVFVHGALCISYSGRCLLSHYMTGRGANQGDCAHPCRYEYVLEEKKRPGQYFPVEEDARGTSIFNSKDLCLLARLPELVNAGVDSLKIEGRMKSIYYVGGVIRIYRAALDYISEQKRVSGAESDRAIGLPPQFMTELLKIGTRGYTENFMDAPPDAKDMLYQGARVDQNYVPVAVVREGGQSPVVETRTPFAVGDRIEYLERGLESSLHTVTEIADREGEMLTQAKSGNLLRIQTFPAAENWETNALLRKEIRSDS